MHIPQPIISEIKTALTEHLGRPPGPLTATPVGGGCISPAARVRSAAGDSETTSSRGLPKRGEPAERDRR